MTQRDLPIGPPTITEPPTVSTSIGTWVQGLSDHIDAEQFAALKAIAGLTAAVEVTERLDQNKE